MHRSCVWSRTGENRRPRLRWAKSSEKNRNRVNSSRRNSLEHRIVHRSCVSSLIGENRRPRLRWAKSSEKNRNHAYSSRRGSLEHRIGQLDGAGTRIGGNRQPRFRWAKMWTFYYHRRVVWTRRVYMFHWYAYCRISRLCKWFAGIPYSGTWGNFPIEQELSCSHN